jgi:hypothetical protein
MSAQPLFDAARRPRSPATLPGYNVGRPPRNKGQRYPADPPTIDEIVAVMRRGGDGRHGRRTHTDRRPLAPGFESTKRWRSVRSWRRSQARARPVCRGSDGSLR